MIRNLPAVLSRSKWMRYALSLLLFASAPVSAQLLAQSDRPSKPSLLQPSPMSLVEALTRLKAEHKVNILFEEKNLQSHFVSSEILKSHNNLEASLKALLEPLGLRYKKKKNNYIILSAGTSSAGLPGRGTEELPGSGEHTAYSPDEIGALPLKTEKIVSGRVTDEKGEALPGVSIMEKGTQKGMTTDTDGRFSFEISGAGSVLVFSFVGYISREIAVGNMTSIEVSMAVDEKSLGEIVVVGYGTQRKTSLTAAVSSVRGEEVTSLPSTNLSNNLGGRLPGVMVKQGSGEPGNDGSKIFIRGISSTGSTQPLLIVDNIPRDFQYLDPNSIESITVLKDAAAVAPYGVAGANGVILVTTKRGKMGTPTLTYNGYVGFQNPTATPKYASSYQFALLKNAIADNAGLPHPYSDYALQKFQDGSDPDAYPVDDVMKELVTKNAVLTGHNIEVSGGTEKVRYYTSFGYQYQAGMWASSNNKRYNLSANVDANVTSTTRLGVSIIGRVRNSQFPPYGNENVFGLIKYATPEYGPLRFSNGMFGKHVMSIVYNDGNWKNNETALYSQLSIEQDIKLIPGLTLRGTIAYDPTFALKKQWTMPRRMATIDTSKNPYVITDGIIGTTKPFLDQQMDQKYQLTYQGGFNYKKEFGQSTLGVLGLFEAKAYDALNMFVSRQNFNLSVDEISMGSSNKADMTTNGTSSAERQVGAVYRVFYGYADKYLVEVSGRYDGSYYFAPENRFGFFPAFSAGWRLSEEKFIKDSFRWIDNLKIRASYGEVGALAGSAFQYMSTYDVVGPAYALGGNAVQAVRERNEPNVNITWERARKTDVGLEGTLFRSRLNFELDWFYEKRSNMLVNPDIVLPGEYGIGVSQENAGIMENRGFELSAGTNFSPAKDLKISVSGNLTYAKNKVLQTFETAATYNNPNRRRTGRPLGTQFGYKAIGYFQLDDFDENGALKPGIAVQSWGRVQPGDIRYDDMNGDGKINVDDHTVIGDPSSSPRIIYGISPTIAYRSLSLNLFFQGVAKTNFYYTSWMNRPFFNGTGAYAENMDYWTPENPNAKHPRLTAAPTSNNEQMSSFWMGNAAYLRLKNVMLAYDIPSQVTQKIGISHLRLFFSGQNVLTWTPIENYDPEVMDQFGYPQQKVLSFGVNVTF